MTDEQRRDDEPAETPATADAVSGEDPDVVAVDTAGAAESAPTMEPEPADRTATEATGALEPSPPDAPAHDEATASVDAVLASGAERAEPSAELKAIIEALIFASPEPLTPKMLFRLLRAEPKEDVLAAIAELRAEYENRPGLMIEELAGGYQIVTRPGLAEWVRGLFHERTTQKLSAAALESLAVIAYKQPITSLEVAEIRGVDTSGVLTTLLERHLIKIVGRKKVVGRPFLYGTTREFLIRFALKDLTELPKIEDMAEALGFDPPAMLMETTPPEDLLPLNEAEAADGEEGAADAAPPTESASHDEEPS